jgi:ABC-type Fe3+-siderophore transport system permease subunit
MGKPRLSTFRETFRDLNRLPFVLGLLAVLVAVMGVVGLIGLVATDSSERPWWASPGFLITETVLMGAFGVLMLVLYYRFRE